MFDLIISGAEIIDGTGAPAFKADVAVTGEYIQEVGNLENNPAKERLDASGYVLTPGFIDVHSHGDVSILVNPQAESKIHQGITTKIIGNCGFSLFPLKGESLDEARRDMAPYEMTPEWDSAEGYFNKLEEIEPAINVACFVGHGTLRGAVMGEKDLPPDAEQMKEMKRLLEESMNAGAMGLSTGLIYAPSFFAGKEELTELSRVVSALNGFYASHIRGESDTLLEAVDEALAIGKDADCGVQVSHLKASAPRNWGKVKTAIEMIEKADSMGMDVAFDKYPYTAGSTGLSSYLPRWAIGQGVDQLVEFLQDPDTRKKIFRESDESNDGEKKWDSVMIIFAGCDEYRSHEGKSLQQIAEDTGNSIEDVFCDILIFSRANADIVCFTQSQDDTDLVLEHPMGLVCTDSGVWAPYGPLSRIKPHPRAYGSFPRFLKRYVKDKKALTREEAVHKITKQSAERFRIARRGVVSSGYYADLVLLDWEALEDKASYTDPHRYPVGVEGVVVNGVVSIQNGKNREKRNGKVLRFNGERTE